MRVSAHVHVHGCVPVCVCVCVRVRERVCACVYVRLGPSINDVTGVGGRKFVTMCDMGRGVSAKCDVTSGLCN